MDTTLYLSFGVQLLYWGFVIGLTDWIIAQMNELSLQSPLFPRGQSDWYVAQSHSPLTIRLVSLAWIATILSHLTMSHLVNINYQSPPWNKTFLSPRKFQGFEATSREPGTKVNQILTIHHLIPNHCSLLPGLLQQSPHWYSSYPFTFLQPILHTSAKVFLSKLWLNHVIPLSAQHTSQWLLHSLRVQRFYHGKWILYDLVHSHPPIWTQLSISSSFILW